MTVVMKAGSGTESTSPSPAEVRLRREKLDRAAITRDRLTESRLPSPHRLTLL